MLNFFGTNVFARKRKVKMLPIDIMSRIETLEDRVVLASQIGVAFSNGNLTLTGSAGNDDVIVTITGTNSIMLWSTGTFTGAGAGPFLVTGNVNISMGGGDDTVSLVGASSGKLDSGDFLVDLGSGNDSFFTPDGVNAGITFTGNVSVQGGTGNDFMQLGGSNATNTFVANSVTVDMGTAGTKTATLDRATIGTNVSIKAGGSGDQAVNIGAAGGSSTVGGSVTITQANGATGYTAGITNFTVTGNVSISNGNSGANGANVNVMTSSVGGTLSVVNGNSAGTNGVLVLTTTVAGNSTVKNGSATGTNGITLQGATFNGKSNTISNGASLTSSTINLGPTAASTFAGAVSATNSSGTGNNFIFVQQGTFLGGLALSNNVAGAVQNQIALGFTGTVAVTGNLVITNAASTTSNTVQVERTTTSGVKLGDVTINNGASGTTSVVAGSGNSNFISGNLTIRNQAASVSRNIALSQTTVLGGSGAYLYNVGLSPLSTISVGVNGVSTISNALKIEDGSGSSSSINLQSAVLGSFNFTDLGGGSDVITIATGGGSSVTVNGVTRIDTGGGSDTVTIGTGATAYFGDLVVIALGAGNDTLTIGSNASSPAFSTAAKFQFDGGAGTDVFNGSPISLADFMLPLPGKLKSKITGFETLNVI